MIRVISDTAKPIKIWADNLEAEAETQVRNLAGLPFLHSHVALMPDAHVGKGSTVGSVIATKGAIIPAAIGVDIGCGMAAIQLPFKIDEVKDLHKLRSSLERSIPVGFNKHKVISDRVDKTLLHLPEITTDTKLMNNAALQIGTLGGGNHFIEICYDQNKQAWLMLHSGSRNIGKTLAEIHIKKAQKIIEQYFISLPDPDLAYLVEGSIEFNDYIEAMLWAQDYAKINRNEMVWLALKDISYHMYGEDQSIVWYNSLFRVDCHHNFTQKENHFGSNVWLTRKGAVSARAGQLGIIPGSMGTKSYIVEGLGNADSFCSCSHGAGRRMSRTKARSTFSSEDLLKQTDGVECRKDDDVIDEIPAAYKDIDVVMENQRDLVKPLYELKQVLCIKG